MLMKISIKSCFKVINEAVFKSQPHFVLNY